MLHFLLEIIIMTRSTKTRLLLRDKCKVVHSDRLYRPVITLNDDDTYFNDNLWGVVGSIIEVLHGVLLECVGDERKNINQ